ncbi:hypothetical protein [Pleomorphovibrio marinus]|uniref:hypothetical protein n=1 Tax=Pleomorphovibrio marinus TaxID=2164132 RepID=UPI0013006A13|nr:hypothetical protein [Pleomorphovibrio marinus]
MGKVSIVLGSYMFRYPLGGMLSWVLQYLTGLKSLGYDVYFMEKSGYENACYDPSVEAMSNDCSYGLRVVGDLLNKYGFAGKWCFVDYNGEYNGLSKLHVKEVFKNAAIFIDMGTHGTWLEEASQSCKTLFLDGEPGFTQIKMENKIENGEPLDKYDFYYTVGCNIGKEFNPTPTLGLNWRHVFHPVDLNIFHKTPYVQKIRFTTVMNWKSHKPIHYKGEIFGQKDQEFQKIIRLPTLSKVEFELALSGKNIPRKSLEENGWKISSGKNITLNVNTFMDFIASSSGEFSVCKEVFVKNKTGWFSDKSAAYLAMGKPVILQDTGFSESLPVGEGLFKFTDLEGAKDSVEAVSLGYTKHSDAAYEIAREYLATDKVLHKMMSEIGL